MALENQAMYQQAMLKQHSKSSMRGNRTKTRGIQSRLAEMDLARKAAFRDIGLTQKRSDLTHAGRMASHKMQKKALKQRKKQLPWQIGIGAGTSILSGLEGQRRKQVIADQAAVEQQRFDQTQANAAAQNDMWRRRLLGGGPGQMK